ncbi:tetrahydromethanopterin S-methyltransferase subunit A [Methermicoccus shengliensis]|uniref:Tetrahydromethanopterin S-methyltransferase subunit A n=1 Tax=Methermicoccus shengliensis TaxID=660064 RepID=A0A832W0F1_9EURY|nr:tetrahydromethanopterin S-methyltransferase subunit A [Methermicoccus shengliensis]KUK04040.1 MAG: Tetrahydromethanopterin S-methyltransferase subunit A [Euryarchaeota archaeon 55_53]KUK29712.1 MAG: Tetrahydromethanopterin S-methyltransferase subunit A [Methanosarcinales archeaon 56_1174]MDI3488051.1 tetrahydromethanopterin S-methyltransferase subunit [Methanosarcinales archaeon]MDN5295672.1 tetrahydromethanopterin S-methyltransferase subunit [Methanosarcinales archaeon]HIH70339.1 tetrahydr
MAEKASPAEGWPIIVGEYAVGDPQSCVAVTTLGSHLSDFPVKAGAAMAGPTKTENIGIERLVANVISNPNIRFLIVAGAEVKGHITGDAIINLHKNGVKDSRIVGAKGAIPYIENLPPEAIERFQKQVEIIEMIGTEDEAAITKAIQDAIARDPGAYPEPPMLVELAVEEAAAEEEYEGYRPMAAELATIRARFEELDRQIAEIGMLNKYTAGMYAGKIEGMMIGLVISLVILGLLSGGI